MMSTNYCIKADIIDINNDTPRNTDTFLIDSNVWFWLTYSGASHSAVAYQIKVYPSYVNYALKLGSSIFRSGLSLAELSHLIERVEYQVYSTYCSSITPKEYRHNIEAERKRIVAEIRAAWGQVKSLAKPLELVVDEPTTDQVLSRIQTQKVDGYDLFILETLAKHNIIQIISDDGDYATVPGIQLFTANQNVLRLSKTQRRLRTR